ncbi:hypothetical protein NQ315_004779 [Exocentrus adspersus]|uniref:Sodium/potassium-transporting ATPase subunit beta-2 n=1 Tax=Exocentrus adspersus TaxID=1586481 RepID=A0AAV8W2T5_9CUCU|nr:hypothetical protein NQ315_004779 [Exocentrus adspersus]
MPQKQNRVSRSLSKQDELLHVQTQYFLKPEEITLTKCDRVKRFIWNPETKQFCGRTGASWAKIGLFYLIFYGMLAALVTICMWVFFQTLDPRIPKWQLDRSIIGTNPGLGFRPMPTNNEESTLIWFQGSNKQNYEVWEQNLLRFLDKYYVPSKIAKGNGQVKQCSYSDFPSVGEVCEVSVRDWEECNKDLHFNYHKNSPCIFVKLNKIYGWTPEYYDDPYDLPKEMPESLVKHIRSINNTRERQNVWVSCEGENPADKEYLGPVTYYPKDIQGFPGYYFPYLNSEGYLSPLVAIKFERPISGIVINIECRAWAKNIRYSRLERTGSVHFELLID